MYLTRVATFVKNLNAYNIMKGQLLPLGAACVIAFIQGNFTLENIGLLWAIIGFMILLFSMVSAIGAWSSVRSYKYQLGLSMSDTIERQRSHTQHEIHSASRFFLTTLVNALIAITGGIFLMVIFS